MSKFKVGDEVKVERVDSGWQNYDGVLDHYIGRTGIVTRTNCCDDGNGVCVEFGNDHWYFHGLWLTLVNDVSEDNEVSYIVKKSSIEAIKKSAFNQREVAANYALDALTATMDSEKERCTKLALDTLKRGETILYILSMLHLREFKEENHG